jgi:GNAT superfamily N-acetyltransferase
MPDMLVKLYDLPPAADLTAQGITVRRALAVEKQIVLNWVGEHFFPGWVSECDIAFSRQPIACYIAVEQGTLLGFACHDATARNFFGPTGVLESQRGRGLGKALLLACLYAMREQGYGYAIIGGVGPVEFYTKTVGATLIEDSTPGVYRGQLEAG